jgi:ATP-dependent exoDNAse (exonuclease V) alpha subunit
LAKAVRAAGYEIEHTADGFEIKGISRDQIESFSRRKEQIDKALEENGLTRQTASARTRDNANTATRGDKSQLSDVDQRYEWRERLREKGIDTDALKEAAKERVDDPDHQAQPVTGEDAVKSALQHLSERDTLVSETSILDEALKAGLGEVTLADVKKAMAEKAGGMVSAGEQDRGEGKTEAMFTTKSAIFREAEILQRAKDGQGKAEPIIALSQDIQEVVSDVSFTQQEINDGKRSYTDAAGSTGAGLGDQVSSLAEAGTLSSSRMREMSERGLDADEKRENPDFLQSDARAGRSRSGDLRRANDDPRVAQVISDFEAKKGFTLGDGQKAAVALALTTEDQHIAIVGAAGAGKTTAMELIVDQYRAAGYEIIGVAPSADAARQLESAGCDDTRTLASALMMKQKEEDAGGKKIFIMDESGMVSAKDMDAFLQKADAEGARTILVGDPLQLAAVESGSPFAQMLETDSIAYARIDEIQRQKDPQLREIAQAFAGGNAELGVQLAKPYMQQVQASKEDWEAAKMKEAEQPKKPEKFVQATEKMMDLAKDKGYTGSENFKDVRKFLDEKAYFVGINADADGAGKGPLAPKEVRAEALARSAAAAYLALSPEEREKTLMMAATNATRQDINGKVREGMKAEGTLGAEGITITALDKYDLTREQATRAEHYTAKNPEDEVIVKFNQEFKDKSGNLVAAKDTQWRVANTDGGKLSLQSFTTPDLQIEIDPARAKMSAYVERKMELSVGDQVAFRQNDKSREIINGTQGEVVGIDKELGVVFIKTDSGMIAIDANRAEVLDYTYCRTVHSSQGATFERAIVVGEAMRQAMAELAYVACSREKISLTIITDDIDRLMKAWEKFADKQYAITESKTKTPGSMKEIEEARHDASMESGGVGDLAKKRAATAQALQEPAQVFVDMPDALDPDLGSDKFAKKVDAAMEKAAENKGSAVDSANAAATGGQATAGATEPVAEAAPVQAQPQEPELELGS